MKTRATRNGAALRAGFLDGVTASGAFISRALTPPSSSKERAIYRGEGLRGDIKVVGRDMRGAVRQVVTKR